MNVLSLGIAFCTGPGPLELYESRRGHEVRILAAEGTRNVTLDPAGTPATGTPHYTFAPEETASDVVNRISRDWPVDMLACWCPEMFPPPREVEDCPVRTVAIVSDWNIYYPQLEHNLARYDVVLTDKLGAQTLAVQGAEPVYVGPLYSHRTPVHRALERDRDIDILFAGNLNHAIHVDRGRCLEQAAVLSDRYRVEIRGGVYGDDYAELLNRAKIVVNYGVRREMNLRCFEALACGALLFVEADNLEVPDLLSDKEGDVVYYDRDNLARLLEHHLRHPDEAVQLSANRCEKARALAGENRLDDLLDRLAEQGTQSRAFVDFSEREKRLAELLEYGLCRVPSQQVWAWNEATGCLDVYPNDSAFLAAAVLLALGGAWQDSASSAEEYTRNILDWSKRACLADKNSAPLWHNLAVVCRRLNATEAEMNALKLTLRVNSCSHGDFMAGDFSDPYCIAWRRALAAGRPRVDIVHAGAATRLAEIAMGKGDFRRTEDLAMKSIELFPEAATPYRLHAAAANFLGDTAAAAESLERGLKYTSFDDLYRMFLVKSRLAVGRHNAARELANESALIFDACPGGEAMAQSFRDAAQSI